MGNVLKIIFLVLLTGAVTGCGGAEEAPGGAGRPSVFVSIEPLRYFAATIGGDLVDVHVLVARGQSPATYEPTARQLTELAESELLFVVGVPMEEQLVPRIRRSFPGVTVVDTRTGLELEQLDGGVSPAGNRRHGNKHSHSEFDPHIWLDPLRARKMAHNVYEALKGMAPAHETDFFRNYRELDRELDSLQTDIAAMLAPVKGKEIIVFHPAYGYFARAFGLEQVAIEAGGITPGSRHLADIIDLARARGVKAIFVQPQFSSTTAAAVAAAVGAKVVTLDPLAADYPANMRRMAGDIRDDLTTE